ncbi:sugar ABC transporter permease [candidate division KSB3 bacterium]|uniref:Sugar ABC transporter permease n=1 Tax=candidate division KSB3 bacterium TaxID=2044937 RepID=A0A2G6EA31_9BACT|nr:MAG: sugar ABC transporter permease [candidate division KSB3 bacterium]PIE30976.1 MAG: sugar ABC transporter permease [candidate division KSB3 bacterium]
MKKKSDWAFVLPGLIWVAVVTQIPFILTLIFSTLRWNLARPDLPVKFYWFKNFWYFLRIRDWSRIPEFYSIVWQTLLITVSALALCTVVGFLLSLLLDHVIPGVNIARTLILGPFFVMSTASGVIWKTTILNTTFGWYGVIAKALGMTPVDVLSYHPVAVIVVLFSWRWMPFFVLVILAGLQSVPGEIVDSMKVDGANWWYATFSVKLPMIRKHISVAMMLGLIFIVKEFGLILVTTAGGPGTRSYTLPYAVFMQVFNASNVGRAGALAAITVMLTLIGINILYQSIEKRSALYD